MGLFSFIIALGTAIGPWVGILLYERIGPTKVWAACWVAGGASAFLLARWRASGAPGA